MKNISTKSDFIIETMEVDQDHIHILVSSFPNISAFQIMRKPKQKSTVNLWKKFPILLKKYFWIEKNILVRWLFCSYY